MSEADLDKSIEELPISVRTYNCLKAANLLTIRSVVLKTRKELREYRNFGRKSVLELEEELARIGLCLSKKPMHRFHVTTNREVGEPILELRDREQEAGHTLIAEFYPSEAWNAHHEILKLAASLNGMVMPNVSVANGMRLEELERRVHKLEKMIR